MNPLGTVSGDRAQRQAALDPTRSFLVQAPAGSGKTELLIQRYLRLLGVVREPEEVLAITFTRKAAAEMRSRVLEALARARQGLRPEAEHLRLGYELALEVVARDAQRGWGLAEQPERLRVGTIDSLNAWLAGRTPLSSGTAAQRRVSEAPDELYAEAARGLLEFLGEEGETAAQLRCLLEHCDNRAERLVQLVADMLARRDQWLRHTGPGLAGDAQRAGLEAALERLVEIHLAEAAQRLPAGCHELLAGLLARAAARRQAAGETQPLAWAGSEGFPQPVAAELPRWRSLAATLLTGRGDWRKPGGIDRRLGFPPDAGEDKRAMQAVLERCAADDALRAALRDVRSLPDPRYSDGQWQVLRSLLALLPLAVALLQEVFRRRGCSDFSQVAAEALQGLAAEEAPGDLALIMDHRLSHLLLDEYQDTSRSQYDLLCRLTAGWEPGDGRSVFLVGDPMQSIYRFREAEVGIYLQTREQGLGGLPLEFLRLATNYRADPALVDWCNRVFPRLLPASDEPRSGAVSYAASIAARGAEADAGVRWHLHALGDRDAEAADVVLAIREALARWPDGRVGILVRSRAHAAHIAPRLRREGIPFTAPDLERLADQAVAQDLLALSRALLHRGDRIAWLALLRGPCCGLPLAALHRLAAADHEAGVWSLLRNPAVLDRLEADAARRLREFASRLGPWLGQRDQLSFRDRVEGAWLQLGGPAALTAPGELDIAEQFFAFLEQQESQQAVLDPVALTTAAEQQPVHSEAADAPVQLMTMHKAKGLEFDTVILPGLGYPTAGSRRPLLLWTELAGTEPPELVLAPLPAAGDDADPLYELLWAFERRRERYEAERLLYVAATRAKRRLHLCAALKADADGCPVAQPGTLLACLWPLLAAELTLPPGLVLPAAGDGRPPPQWQQPALRRLPADWTPPVALRAPGVGPDAGGRVEYEWASPWARHVGQVVHRWLQEIARDGVERFDAERLERLRPAYAQMLARLGTPAEALPASLDRVCAALCATIEDPRGRWLLSAEHPESASELAVSLPTPEGFQLLRIDRCLVDTTGTRWIVDFKTSEHEGADLAAFLASEAERYAPQLARYREALNRLRPMPTRTALYYPLLGEWLELDPAAFEPAD